MSPTCMKNIQKRLTGESSLTNSLQSTCVLLFHFFPVFFFFLTDFTTIQRKNELDSHKTDQRSGGVKKKDGGPRRMGRIMVGGNAKSRNC